MATDVQMFFEELNAGVFGEKLGAALSKVGGSVLEYSRAGEVSIKLKFKRIGSSQQVAVAHTLSYSHPTLRGEASEKDTTETPMYVGKKGRLTLFPEDQYQMFDKDGRIAAPAGQAK